MQAYCMKCRAKREMKDARSITMKNGKPATIGSSVAFNYFLGNILTRQLHLLCPSFG